MDRRDPGTVEFTREVVPAAFGERRADSRAQLPRGPARVRNDEYRVDGEAAVADGADDPLDEHGRLAGAGTGRHEDLAARLDCRKLLLVQLVGAHGRSILHIGQRSHHVGQSPPRGS